MHSTRKQTTANPRFPHGLGLLLWTGGLILLAYGLMHMQMEKKPFDAVVTLASYKVVDRTHLQPTPDSSLGSEWVHGETSQEIFLKEKLAAIQREKNSERHEELIKLFVNQIAIADIQSVLNDLMNMGPSDISSDISSRLVRRWAENDGPAAAAWAEQLPAGSMRENALAGVAIVWADSNFTDAASWAQQLTDEKDRAATILTVANETVRTAPVEALRLAVELPADNQRDYLICHAAMEWAVQDVTNAVQWAVQVSDVQLRSRILSGMVTAWSESDPVSAATFAVNEIPPGRAQDDAVIGIIERWAQQQPEQAAAWVEQFPTGQIKLVAMDNLIAQWSLSDSQRAEQWRVQMLSGSY